MTKLERIGADLKRAREKQAEWNQRVKDLENRYREEENGVIHSMVHAANLTRSSSPRSSHWPPKGLSVFIRSRTAYQTMTRRKPKMNIKRMTAVLWLAF